MAYVQFRMYIDLIWLLDELLRSQVQTDVPAQIARWRPESHMNRRAASRDAELAFSTRCQQPGCAFGTAESSHPRTHANEEHDGVGRRRLSKAKPIFPKKSVLGGEQRSAHRKQNEEEDYATEATLIGWRPKISRRF